MTNSAQELNELISSFSKFKPKKDTTFLAELSQRLECQDSLDFLLQFRKACERVQSDISLLEIDDEIKTDYFTILQEIKKIFSDGDNSRLIFNQRTNLYYTPHIFKFGELSAILAQQNIKKSELIDIREAFEAIKDVIDLYLESDYISEKIKKILYLYLEQMISTLDNYKNFGEQDFWEIYKKTFATFVQIHDLVIDPEENKSIKAKVEKSMSFLRNKLSFAADTTTITSAGVTLLNS